MTNRIMVIGSEELQRAVPMTQAVRLMKDAFAAHARGEVSQPVRSAIEVPDHGGVMLTMPCHVPGMGLGAKIVSLFSDNASRGLPATTGLMVVLEEETGRPAALIDGAAVTAWRTAAVAGAATELLGRPDSSVGAVIGAGAQARTQVVALDTVGQFEEIRVYGPTSERVAKLVEEVGPSVKARLVAAISVEQAVSGATVISTATPATKPVLERGMLADGAHINAVGSFTLAMAEIDQDIISRARVVVDDRSAAMAEAGELVAAAAAGLTDPDSWSTLGEVVMGRAAGRGDLEEITLFKSVGLALQDVALASYACRSLDDPRWLEL